MRFRHPTTDYIEAGGTPFASFLWCILFGGFYFAFIGGFYFAFKGVWRHFFLYIAAAILTLGVSWLIYPFFASGIVNNSYRRNGWRAVGP